MSTDMSHPVTAAELRKTIASLATKADLANHPTKADLANHPTKADLANHPTKAELREALAPYATKDYVHEVAQTLLGQMERMDLRMTRMEERLIARIESLAEHVSVEIARHTQASAESLRAEMRAMMDPHRDHPERIARLERAVFPDGGGTRAKARVRPRPSRR